MDIVSETDDEAADDEGGEVVGIRGPDTGDAGQ